MYIVDTVSIADTRTLQVRHKSFLRRSGVSAGGVDYSTYLNTYTSTNTHIAAALHDRSFIAQIKCVKARHTTLKESKPMH